MEEDHELIDLLLYYDAVCRTGPTIMEGTLGQADQILAPAEGFDLHVFWVL